MPDLFVKTFVLVLGLLCGSFASVLIARLPAGENWIKGRSHCPKCHAQIPWWQNIPLFSFLLLRGCCGQCKKP
ncbi:MAG TPA: prepilin peptidase, partial [Bdellovibrionota bacterium]|nr:prepilin peptidase [Bdellovibrionota bacterium]